jgi:hypothetical protein
LCMPDTKTAGVLTIVVDISIPSTELAASDISSSTSQVYLHKP